MIGQIAGKLVYRSDDHVLIRAGGVGYIVYCTQSVLLKLPPAGTEITLYTDLLVQENNLQLFGFSSLYEKQWHRLLVSISGIGAKGAVAILNTLDAQRLAEAILLGDWHAVRNAPGIGPKIARRVVNELKDKAPSIMAIGANAPGLSGPVLFEDVRALDEASPQEGQAEQSAAREAVSALSNLGYEAGEAARTIAQVRQEGQEHDVASLIRSALQKLAVK